MEDNRLKDATMSPEDMNAVFNVLGHALDPASGDFDGDLKRLASRVTGLESDDPAQAERLMRIARSIDDALEQADATQAVPQEADMPEAMPDRNDDPLEAAIAEPPADTFEEEALSELNAVLGMRDDVLPETLARKTSA